ncbi:MAG: hypothetical protein GY714_01705 [Desulfobacterales bacterium]|nr:hypothetical protein [Desulfobacterales bacterium]
MTNQITITPQKGKQELACNLVDKVSFTIYGGARGSGKSYLLNMLPLKHINDPFFQGIFFRRQYNELTGAGGLWDTANEMYPQFGGKANIANLKYKFPAGSDVRFSHMFTEKDMFSHRGLQYSFIGFDEIDQFSKEQVTFLMTCLRSKADMDSFCIGTVNPDPDSWVLELVEWYLDDAGFPVEARCGVIRYFVVINGDFVFADDEQWFKDNRPDSVYVTNPVSGEKAYIPPKTFTFINGNIYDNPALIAKNPRYLSELQNLIDHERARQLWGNWYARPIGSNYFQRDWLVEVEKYPAKSKCCRAWDKAATQPSDTYRWPDYTASSPRLYMHEGLYYIVWDTHEQNTDPKDNASDIKGRFRLRSGERDQKILQQAKHDGTDCHVIFAVDPAAAGKIEYEHSAKAMVTEGFIVKPDPTPSNKSKLTRFQPFASACSNGLVRIVRSSFPNKSTYDAYMKELEAFDGTPSTPTRKDDWADATASAFNYLSKMVTVPDFILPSMAGNGTPVLNLKNLMK